MNMRRNRRVRNRALIILLLPVAIVLWMVGWVLYSRGPPDRAETETTPSTDDGIQISVGVPEKEAEYIP